MVPLSRTVRFNLCRLSTDDCYSRQFLLPIRSLKKMNRTPKPPPSTVGFSSKQQISTQKPLDNVYCAEEARQFSEATTRNEKSQFSYEEEYPSLAVCMGSRSKGRNFDNSRNNIDLGLGPRNGTVNSSEVEGIVNVDSLQEERSWSSPFGGQSIPKNAVGTGNSEYSEVNKRRTILGLESSNGTVNSFQRERIVTNASSPSHFGKKNVKTIYVQKSPSGQSKCKNVVDTKNSHDSEGNIRLEPRHETVNSSELEEMANAESLQEELSFPSQFGKQKLHSSNEQNSLSGKSESKNVDGTKNSDHSGGLHKVERFNICWPGNKAFETQKILRPGMVLLKSYISLGKQIDIVKTCQTLGVGPGGFYRPGYKDGAKLSLQMMCLGLNWDPQTRKYDKRHPVDNCEPPDIPHEFRVLVLRAIEDAHDLIKKDSDLVNPEDVLPSMSPDICIVNFYTRYGRLGLHQDRDESQESLNKGLPVVSLSIGDSAEFLYGDQRDVEKAEKVILDSGDVLIFGGESRMVFHGVPSIIPKSAPGALIAETRQRPGRLNLTFRRY